MYEALVALEEGADLAEVAARESSSHDASRFVIEAEKLRRQAAAIRKLIEEPRSAPIEEKKDHVL